VSARIQLAIPTLHRNVVARTNLDGLTTPKKNKDKLHRVACMLLERHDGIMRQQLSTLVFGTRRLLLGIFVTAIAAHLCVGWFDCYSYLLSFSYQGLESSVHAGLVPVHQFGPSAVI
jgi:hypothetical protein